MFNSSEGSGCTSGVQARRESVGLSRSALAARAGMSRQALHAIETGGYVPNTLVALKLARALECRVEDLFVLEPESPGAPLEARWLGPSAPRFPTRVRLFQVGEQLLALPLSGEDALTSPADGVCEEAGRLEGEVSVRLYTSPSQLEQVALICGCDPAFGLLAATLERSPTPARMVWRNLPSTQALESLGRGEAHAAGIHLWHAPSGQYNLPFVELALAGQAAQLITLWTWEQGLLLAPGNPLDVTGIEDLTRGGLRLVNRPQGAGSRHLLDRLLEEAGLSQAARTSLPGYGREASTHLELAETVARGEADAGLGIRSVADALGLAFVPLVQERFDLVVPERHLEHPALRALLEQVRQPAFRREVEALGGYDPRHAGEVWASTA